jgi:tetratricopeptide (TPR) repeat protein
MSFLEEPGDLARTPLAAILLEALNHRATGVLRVEHGGGTSRLYFRGGAPVGAQVFGAFKPLGHVLLQRGVIDIDALSRSLTAMAETRRPQGELLVEMGAASRADVDRALSEQQEGYFGVIADLPSGAYAFDASAEIPAWARGTLLSPLRTIVDALERPQAQALVASALQLAAGGVRLASGYAALADDFRWSVAEEALVAPLAGPTSLEVFFEGTEVSPERARAIVAALLLLSLAVPVAEQPHARGDTAVGLFLDLAYGVDEASAAEGSTPNGKGNDGKGSGNANPNPASLDPLIPSGAAPGSGGDTEAPRSRGTRDPAEARARRQRLLQRAMINMGIGPLAGRPRPPGAAAPLPSPGASAQPSVAEASLRHAFLQVAPRAKDLDLFARLAIPTNANRDQVRQAYLQLAKGFHPDRFAAPAFADLQDAVRDFFTAVNEAYEVLSHDERRGAYLAERANASSRVADAARLDFQKGEVCLRAKEWTRARGFFEAAVRADPQPDYLAVLAWTFVADPVHRDPARARALLDKALRDSRCARARYVSGLVARDGGDEGEAERWFRAAVQADPRFTDAQRELRSSEARRARLRD